MSTKTVFVCGATGTQGGALARHLRAKDVQVHALARDPTSDKAKALESIGVKVWAGDYDNREALAAATSGVSAVFINLMPDFSDLSAEARWAANILDAGKAGGARHVVYSSGFGVGELHKRVHLDPAGFVATIMRSKATVEAAVQSADYETWAILRPGNFMANYLPPHVRMYPGLVDKGVWTTALRADTLLPMIDTETMGRFSCSAVLEPERFGGKTVTYADQTLRVEQVVEQLAKATGRDLKAVYLSDEEAEAQKGSNPFIEGQMAMRDMAQFVNMDEVKEWGIPLSTFEEFLKREKKTVDETYKKST